MSFNALQKIAMDYVPSSEDDFEDTNITGLILYC